MTLNQLPLKGSNDDEITEYDSGNWQLITQIDDIPAWTGRFQTKELFFDNDQGISSTTAGLSWHLRKETTLVAMQIAEVELLGAVPPADVTSPWRCLDCFFFQQSWF